MSAPTHPPTARAPRDAAPSTAVPPSPTSTAGARTGSHTARALTIFAVLWACAAIFHQAAYPAQAFRLTALLVVLPALWLLLKPSSVPRLGAMAALQLVQVGWHGLARASNHWLVVTVVNVAIVVAVARVLAVGRGRPDRGELLATLVPAGRAALVLLYCFAVFHKLNADFLDPAVSCATAQYANLVATYPMLPTGAWVDQAAIVGTLAVEALIPVLLLVRRTRIVGVLGAAAFHFLLALNPEHTFFDFTSMLFALYFLFVPFDYPGAVAELTARRRATRPWVDAWARRLRRAARLGLVVVALGLVAGYLRGFALSDRVVVNLLTEGVRGLFVVYGIVVVGIFAAVARRYDVTAWDAPRAAAPLRRPLLALVAALLVVNGLTPYVGLKTEASFAMFSNLRTEGGRSNHLLVPAGVRVAGYQEDLVRVLDSSAGRLRSLARSGLLLPFVEFRARASQAPNASVTYERGGRVHVVARIAGAPELRPLTWGERSLLRFRAVDAESPRQRCRH